MTHSQIVKLGLKEKEFNLISLPILNSYWMSFGDIWKVKVSVISQAEGLG